MGQYEITDQHRKNMTAVQTAIREAKKNGTYVPGSITVKTLGLPPSGTRSTKGGTTQEAVIPGTRDNQKILSIHSSASGGIGGDGGARSGDSPASSVRGADDPLHAKLQTGRNLDQERPADGGDKGKTLKYSFSFESIQKALPAFLRMCFKAANNVAKIFTLIPFFPFEVSFEEMNKEEGELFAEVMTPGMEAALPTAVKKHPIIFLILGFIVGILGKIVFKVKEGFFKKKPDAIDAHKPVEHQKIA